MSGCEGRCGVLLTDDMRERHHRTHSPGRFGIVHTPHRCRLIRTYRDALADALPGWDIAVWPWTERQLVTRVERVEGSELRSCGRSVPMEPPAVVPHAAAFNAAEVRRQLNNRP